MSRLTDDEIVLMSATHDIISLGMMADESRQQRHDRRTTFVRVAELGAEAPAEVAAAAGEVRVTGVPASRKDALERVAKAFTLAKGIPVSAFSLADLEQLAGVERVTLRSLLEDLHAAGLELIAEAPIDRLQDPRRSIEEVNIAGLALARLTVHQLAPASATALFRQVADVQRRVGVIRSFAPLPRTANPSAPTTGFEDVKSIALARLILDNVASIQVDWSLYGPKLAQVALTVGADDLDGVSPEDETGAGSRRAPLQEILRNIRAAGQEPVERNGRFEPLAR